MVRRILLPAHRDDVPPPVLEVEALDHFGRLTGLMGYMLDRRDGYPAPLDVWLHNRGRWPDPSVAQMWARVVGATVLTCEMLVQSLPRGGEGDSHRSGLQFLIMWLEDGVAELLRDAWHWWPRQQDELRQFILQHVRRDDPEDRRLIDEALRACGVAEDKEQDHALVRMALRALLAELSLHAGTQATRADLRSMFGEVAHARAPRRARHVLARGLARRAAKGDQSRIEEHVFLRDSSEPSPLPGPLVMAVLLPLAALDVLESGGRPRLLWRSRSAHGVLRRALESDHLSGEMVQAARGIMEGAVDLRLLERIVDAVVGRDAHPAAGTGRTAAATATSSMPGPGVQAAPLLDAESQEASGAATEVVSPGAAGAPRRDLDPLPRAACGSANTLGSGDGTETSQGLSSAGPSEVVSPRGPEAAEDAPAAPPGNPLEGGDGTEISEGLIHGDPPEVSSPAAPRDDPAPLRPEDLAIAYLVRAVHEGRPVPSLTACAKAAGVSKQATANWPRFRLTWKNAKAIRGGRIRRGYRSARTGDIEAVFDDD